MTSVLWLTRYGHEGASSRYRVVQFIEPLGHAGISSTVRPLARWRSSRREAALTVTRRLADFVKPPVLDVVVIQKDPVMPAAMWPVARRLIVRIGAPIIWDVDDAIWLNSSGQARMAREMAQLSTHVVAGNELIARWASSVGARSVSVIPTCYSPAASLNADDGGASGRVNVVWVGTPSTARLLEHEVGRLRVIASIPGVQVTFVGGEPPPELRSLPNVEVLAWSPEVEHRMLSNADFGLALQPRTEFADHKCGFKVIQYMAYGVIPIASDNFVHRHILSGLGCLVTPGLADDELAAAISKGVVASDRNALRERWRCNYSTEVGVGAWKRLLGEVEP